MRLDLGAGKVKREGYISVDKVDADVEIDLEEDKLPFPDDSIEEINAIHVLEHIKNLKHILNECWRVLAPGGTLWIEVPKFPSIQSVQDPTHVRFFVETTFDYFTLNSPAKADYGYLPWERYYLRSTDSTIWVAMRPVK